MQFKLKMEWEHGKVTADWHDEKEMREELARIADLLPNFVLGEKITVERIS